MPDSVPTARVIADSISPRHHRLTTFEVRLHRFVLAEFNTHRTLTRNAASSRAIPAVKMMMAVTEDPAVPVAWPAEAKGMQGGALLDDAAARDCHDLWLSARRAAITHADALIEAGLHKSVVNRLLEPFAWTTIIASGTDWDGFFAQRCHPDAQPELRAAAEAMRTAYDASVPMRRRPGQWHMPYLDPAHDGDMSPSVQRRVSAARCARVSYLTHDGRRDHGADLDLYHRLTLADPPHASPLEHVATPAVGFINPRGNFRGWHQMRHMVLGDRP